MRASKKRNAPARVQIRDARGQVAFDGRIDALAIPDAHVIALSVEFFSDPDPCFIHRGAVLSRAYAELEQALTGRGWTAIEALDPPVRAHLCGYEPGEICITEGL